jgi:hypothetical protein
MHRHSGKTGIMAAKALVAIFFAVLALPILANPANPVTPNVTYADLADFADSAPIVVQAQLRKLTKIAPERTRGVLVGWARFYVEARTTTLFAGENGLGESLRYLVDLPLDPKGKPPALKKIQVLLFARAVPGRIGELQLVAPDAQVIWDAKTEGTLRSVLRELVAPDSPPRITGISEVIHVPGNLAGEGETQMFLTTHNGSAASITVTRRAESAPSWGVSFSEVLEGGSPPQRDSLRWYRLACFLPQRLPPAANLSETARDKAVAEADYRFVMSELGPCPRRRN